MNFLSVELTDMKRQTKNSLDTIPFLTSFSVLALIKALARLD